MRIDQAYVSKSVADFPFHAIYRLNDYRDVNSPSVFFGCYRFEDIRIINSHQGPRTIFWTGQDILNYLNNGSKLAEARHVTAHPKVYALLKKEFENVLLVNPSTFLNEVKAQPLGNKIYAYCPDKMASYHGVRFIDELKQAGYEIVIGDGQWSQNEWRNGKADYFYQDVGIGLCLSDFAGGGTSIIEMGLRGIRVVTNVFQLPNCLKFVDAQDIAKRIEREKKRIGTTDKLCALQVWNALDHGYKWLEI
jgi:hypothetical protein